jgi:hypothetical protein
MGNDNSVSWFIFDGIADSFGKSV